MRRKIILISIAFWILGFYTVLQAQEGITATTIRLGSVLALKGKAKGLGTGMKKGIEAALKGQKVQGRSFELLFENDFYEPPKAAEGTKKLVSKDIFLMIGNVGTPTAIVTLPILKENNIPAVGFFTGAGVLRPGAKGPIANYRASYIQETAAVIDSSIASGLKPTQICAYVQNDGYGMAGLTGIKLAMERANAPQGMITTYNKLLGMSGNNPPRNDVGPVGVYRRNTNKVLKGYQSLKNWEKASGNKCKLVITVGAYSNIAQFARNASAKGEDWIISAVSFTGADNFQRDLAKYKSTDKIVMTQVVPLLDSTLPIVQDAKRDLGKDFGFVTLEGYIVGKMTLAILKDIKGKLTRDNFMKQVRKTKMDLGGVKIDFTKNGYQGSDLVIPSYVTPGGYKLVNDSIWKTLIQ